MYGPSSKDTHGTVRARAPLRLGLAGGGTDLEAYADRFAGAVLNATIDRYAYAFISPRTDDRVCFRARDLQREEVHELQPRLTDSNLLLHRGVYERVVRQLNGGRPLAVTVTTTVDAPMGSGLGSSSALVVALVDAYRTMLGVALDPKELAKLAWDIERRDLKIAGGRQDQYAASFGGVNFMEFFGGERVAVNPLPLTRAVRNELESSLITCFTGRSRHSDSIIRQQTDNITADAEAVLESMHQLKTDASDMKAALLTGDIERMAGVLERSWAAKRRTAQSINTPEIDRLYALAVENGALAGKVSGAGGGGFMMFIVRPERRLDVIEALTAGGFEAGPVKLTSQGCETWRASVSDASGLAAADLATGRAATS